MDIKDFPNIQIDSTGQYHLVPHHILRDLLKMAKNQPKKISESKFLAVQARVGELIRVFRNKHDWTQEDLVVELKSQLSLRTITNLEGGKQRRKPHFSSIEVLINFFGSDFATELSQIIPITQSEFDNF